VIKQFRTDLAVIKQFLTPWQHVIWPPLL